MPVTKSALRALKKDKKRTQVNKIIRSRFKNIVKKTRQSPSKANLKLAFSYLDRAAKKGVIHKKKAARLKSRLARKSKSVKPA